jgi:cyclopropane fatty-acyl-phospholipid synthase-like methyltransferase
MTINTLPWAQEAHLRRMITYYDETYLDYRLLWMNPATLALHFGFWDERTRTHAASLINMNRVLAARASLWPGERVLDAGCGVGGSAIWLAREFGVQVVGISLVPSQLARAHRFARQYGVSDRVIFEQQDFTHTTFPDNSFDVIWAVESVCHALDKSAFLAEAGRLLKPGGRLIMADWFRRRRPFDAEGETLLHDWLSGWAVPDLLTADEFTPAAAQAGFTHIRLDDVTAHVRPSLRRLYRLALIGYPAAMVLWALGLRNDVQLGNARSALRQYQALGRNLWFYGHVSARRST